MTILCTCCDQPFDANGYCSACGEYAVDQLPAKTLEQKIAEDPELQAYQAEIRASIERDLRFTMELQRKARAA